LYPFIEIFSGTFLYAFGVALSICFFAFLWLLKKLSKRFAYSFTFFSHNILWFFVSVFIFSRLLYVIGRWNDMKFIKDPFQFFIMSEFNFSLFGAIFWFFIVLFILLRLERGSLTRYIDGLVLSFLFILIIGYIGAFFGWQVYGRETSFGIEILYKNPFTPVPYQVPVFPLPIVYTLISFLIFSAMYMLSLFIHIKGYIGYMGLILFSAMILIFEFFSGKQDIVSIYSVFNLPQIYALILALWSWYQLFHLFLQNKDTDTQIKA